MSMSRRRPKPPPDLAGLLPSWEVALAAERKSPKTIRVYRDGVRAFIRWCADTGTDPILTRAAVAAFTVALLDGGAEAHTARTRQQALRRFAAWLLAEGELEDDPLLGMKPPQLDVKVAEPLDADELKRLIKACAGTSLRDRRDEAIVRLMGETGARAGEVCAMTVDDIDVRRGMAVIRRGKGGRGRVIPFGPQTGVAIDRYLRTRRTHRLAATAALWLGDRSQTFSYTALQKSLGSRARVAGIDRFHPHLLRHTAATRWLAAGGSEGGLMAVAGWRSREMLDRYVAATASERAAAEARGLNLGDL
jgi:site-specific recombinase XerD